MALIAVDIGGSSSRVRTDGTAADVLGPALTVTRGRADHDAVIDALADLLPPPGPVEVVAIGAAGLLSLGDPAAVAARAFRAWRPKRVVVVPDAVAALRGVWGDSGGVVVAAGTGVIGLASDLGERWQRSDGWGHLLGDAGGGAWIGARGLGAALRQRDGRTGGSERLLIAVRERFDDPALLPSLVRGAANEATFLAGFAPAVADAARSGDPIALAILQAAGSELADTGLSLLASGIPERIALTGGVAAIGEPLTSAFLAGIRSRRPAAEVSVGEGSPVDGAMRLASDVAAGHRAAFPPFINVFEEGGA